MTAAGRCALGLVLLLAACRRGPERPNLLLVTIDTLRADHCSAYGYGKPTTPRLEALARDGVRCELAYAPMPSTGPSHATMFTGLLPRRHGVRKNGHVLGGRHRTLAETLARAGYRTHAIVSSFILGRRFGLDQGFASYDESLSGSADPKEALFQTADRARRKAVDWLRTSGDLGSTRPAQPFFLWVHIFDPHEPYAPPLEHRRPFAPPDESDALRSALASYDGEVRFADAELGLLLDALAGAGRLDDTLVVITADHGEGLMAHGHMSHGPQLYEEAVRVPLVLRWPRGLPKGTLVEDPVLLADLQPTLLTLAGVSGTPDVDGIDLAERLRGRQRGEPNRVVLLERRQYKERTVDGGLPVRGTLTGVRLGRFKYLEAPAEGRRELYDLLADPGERHDLSAERPREAESMARLLAAWQATSGVRPELADESAETRDALRALGYVQ
ncbi:MAG TPA: sulfatase-like hydrolase/transferase [Vicinamibacteria bacterium]|nr:sulfatase-like hydrolase/transferase [Vicinamibacteria bacterium]